MTPAQLAPASFAGYPPQARDFAVAQLPLLRTIPLIFAAILLREVSTYDWRFPAERDALGRQFKFLSKLNVTEWEQLFASLRGISHGPDIEVYDWVNDPGGFMEKLTASLWSTHQMEAFRQFATSYQEQVDKAVPPPQPEQARLGMVVYDEGLESAGKRESDRLSRYGVTFTAVKPTDGWPMLLQYASLRANATSPTWDKSFRHWYIDGGSAEPSRGLVPLSYATMSDARTKLLKIIQGNISSGSMGPEGLRSALARMTPSQVGLTERSDGGILDRFKLSLLTEGSGTQIFATTFAQWAARESIRRAEPETLLVRFRPRQRAIGMDQMLTPDFATEPDPEASMVDARMGTYYTWLNLRRLSGGENLRFFVWQQGSSKALMIGPGLPQGTSSNSPLTIRQILAL